MDIYDDYRNSSGCSKGFRFFLACLLLLLGLIFFSACKTVKPVVVPQVHNQYHGQNSDHTSDRRDSVYIHDSIYIREKGDTVLKVVHHTEFRIVEVHDTLLKVDSIHVQDSIPYPVEVPGPTVYIKSGYTKFTSWFFWICIILFILWAAWKICDRVPATSPYTFAIKTALKTFLRLKS